MMLTVNHLSMFTFFPICHGIDFFQDLPEMGCLRVIKTYHSGLNGKRLTTTWLKAKYEKSNRHTVLLDLSLLDLLMVEADEGQEELR